MRNCDACVYTDKDVTDEPCFKCLSGYSANGCFVRKEKKRKNTERKKDNKKREIVFKDENCPLPWSS